MVKLKESDLDTVFSALSDPTRRWLIEKLSEREHTVSELAEPLEMSLPAVSKHLRILENAGLMKRRREGRTHHLNLEVQPMQKAMKWIQFYRRFWEDSFDALEQHLNQMTESEKSSTNDKK